MSESISFINKQQKELTFDDFYDGQYFEGTIHGKPCTGRVTIQDDSVFLCQNVIDGYPCKDKKGFNYSYVKLVWDDDIVLSDLRLEKEDKNIYINVSNLDEETFDWLLSSFSDELKLVDHSKGELSFSVDESIDLIRFNVIQMSIMLKNPNVKFDLK